MGNLKVLSLFSGIGAFEKALDNIDVDFDLVGYSEIDSKASKAYAAIHGVSENLNLGDVCLIDETKLPDFDIMTWGFPCTNFSNATRDKVHNRRGLENSESGLYFEGIRILKEKKPYISIIENVPDLVSDKFKEQFSLILNDLEEANYTTSFAVLNGSDFNLPQNRKRVFVVSIRNDIYQGFDFPTPVPLIRKVKDFLEDDEYIDDKYKRVNPVIIDKIMSRRIYNKDICSTITKAIGRAGSSSEYISNCAVIYQNTGCIRRMTPKETMLLTGFDEQDYIKAKQVSSDTNIFNFSGNSICVTVLEHLFEKLLLDYNYKEKILSKRTAQEDYMINLLPNNQLMFKLD